MKIKKKTAALLFACVWAIFALAASVAFRAVTANAFSMDDVITVKVFGSGGDTIDPQEDDLLTWGTFYRGIRLLDEASEDKMFFKTSTSTSSVEATVKPVYEDTYTFTDDGEDHIDLVTTTDTSKTFGKFDRDLSPLDTACEHDFISEAGDHAWESIDGETHWAVCSSCESLLQVPHRPDGKGGCKDCDATLDDYANTYTFSGIPDGITNNEDMAGDGVVFFEDGVAEFEIEVEATLFLGSVLKLNLESENGELTEENGTTIPYTIDISLSSGDGDATSSFGFSGPEEIWWYEAPTEYDDPDNLMTAITATITITLTVEPAYAGTFTDTLTFSVTLETEE